jgi:hypothetical protein
VCSAARRAAREAEAEAGEHAAGVGLAAQEFAQSGNDRAMAELLERAGRQGERLAALWEVEKLHLKEARAGPVLTMGLPMIQREDMAWAKKEVPGGAAHASPAPSFAIRQGTRANGTPKWRVIHDHKRSGVNGATRTPESVDLISFMWPVWAAMVVAAICKSRGHATPRMTIGLDDLRAAYRTVPQALPGVAAVAYWSFVRGTVSFQTIPGHSFGNVGSVSDFSSWPRFACAVMARFLLSAYAHYVDDFINLDVAAGG